MQLTLASRTHKQCHTLCKVTASSSERKDLGNLVKDIKANEVFAVVLLLTLTIRQQKKKPTNYKTNEKKLITEQLAIVVKKEIDREKKCLI